MATPQPSSTPAVAGPSPVTRHAGHGLHRVPRVPLTRADLLAPRHLLVLAAGVVAVAGVGFVDMDPSSPLWPLTGVAVATGMLARVRWALLLIAVVGLAGAVVVGPVPAAAAAAGAVSATVVCARSMRRNGMALSVDNVPTLLHLVGLAAVVAPLVAASTGTLVLAVTGQDVSVFLWTEWLAVDSLACVLVAVPMVIWWSQSEGDLVARSRAADALLGALALVLIVLGTMATLLVGGVPLGFLVLLPVIGVAMRWYARGVVLAVYLVTALTAWLTLAGRGAFADDRTGVTWHLGRFWLLIVMTILSGALVAIGTRQRDEAARGLVTDNLALAARAGEQARTLSTLMSNLPGVAYRCRNDPLYETLFVSQGASEVYGVDADVVRSGRMSLAAPIHPDDLPGVRRDVERAVAAGRPYRLEYRIRRSDGETRWVWEQGQAVTSDTDGSQLLEGFIYDVTDRVTSERLLLDEARVLDGAMSDHGPAAILADVAEVARNHVDGAEVVVIELGPGDVVASVDGQSSAPGPAWAPTIGRAVAAHAAWSGALSDEITRVELDDSTTVTVCPVVASEGGVCALLGLRSTGPVAAQVLAAVSHVAKVAGAALSHARTQERLRFEAVHDTMTGLPNRRALEARLAALLGGATPRFGVLFTDVSGFRVINETYGHAVGDGVLSALATRTAAALPADAELYRFAGDQLVVVAAGEDDPEALTRLARLFQRVASGPYRVGQQAVHLTVTVGVTVSRPDSASATDLIGEGASACDAAREVARDAVLVYDRGLRERSRQLLQTESGLRRALCTDEIEAWFQPEYDLATGAFIGAEALVRWRMPDGRMVMPDEFIPVAESSGLMGPLGLRVLAEACTQGVAWPGSEAGLLVSVNVATSQLLDPLFPASVSDVLGYTNLDPARLCLEITESALVDADAALTALTRLRALGVLVAIDDFGTGYSSLSRLKGLPVDFLKIDRAFVSGIGVDVDDTAIVDAIVALARTLHLRTIAEGVETSHQASELRARGVNMGQGFLWSRPLPAADLLTALRSPTHGALRRPVNPAPSGV